MTREVINKLKNYTLGKMNTDKVEINVLKLNRIIKALEQEPCEDCISRQAAIDAFERFIHELGIKDEPYNYGEMALSVRNVPPVTPKSKTEVLDRIRAEIHATAELHEDGDYYLRDKWIDKIFDKYKAESEE